MKKIMKKVLLLGAAAFLAAFTVQAQNYMVIDTEKIFKSIPAYMQALETLNKQTETYQKNIDDAYAQIEALYQDYESKKDMLPQATRTVREDEIIRREREVLKYEEAVFGQEGELIKKRVELIKPIQDKVFAAIDKYAKDNNFGLVLDIASNPSILYYAPSTDKTEDIIKLTK